MGAGAQSAQQDPKGSASATPQPATAGAVAQRQVLEETDLAFIHQLADEADGTFKRCMQCGTCSGTCKLSPLVGPFPRKEMAWAAWGLKERLLSDPDVWLCHQCNDCAEACPRGTRPGDVLAAVRRISVRHYAFPRFLARWTEHPRYLPLLLAIPAGLLYLALMARDPLADALGLSRTTGDKIVYAYSSELPHWLINGFFGAFALLVLLVLTAGVARFWRAMRAADGPGAPARGVIPCIITALWSAARHDRFADCGAAQARPGAPTRSTSHLLVLSGFGALALVSLTVVTAPYNPLLRGALVYPFNFWSPYKLAANIGGLALLAGCLWMAVERLRERPRVGASRFADWALLWALSLATLTGFAAELLHYLRLEPHRHAIYFIHLVFVFALLVYMPYSKLAHAIYRITAMVYAERTGRGRSVTLGAVTGRRGRP